MLFIFLIVFHILLASTRRIDKISGLNFKLYSNHYTGFLNVSDTRRYFYWLVESQNTPSEDPLIFWFNGGPGCSSLFGLFREHGPVLLNSDGETFRENEYSWSRIASVVYIESPVGVGYSYSTDSNNATDDHQTAAENYEAIKKFLREFSQFRHHDVFLTGESYGGIYVPMLAEKIIDGHNDYPINLKGIAIGNGYIHNELFRQSQIIIHYSKSFVNVDQYLPHLKSYCDGSIRKCLYSKIIPYWSHFESVRTGIDFYDTKRKCPADENCSPYTSKNLERYLNKPNVRDALNIPHSNKWEECSKSILYNYDENNPNVKHQILKAVGNNVKTLLYYGDADLICSFQSGQQFAATLGVKKLADKSPWFFNNTLGGYKTLYDGLTFLTVRGAGHSVPETHPAQMFHVIQQFIKDQPINFSTLLKKFVFSFL